MSENNNLFFYKGSENILEKESDQIPSLEKIKDAFGKVVDGKNLSFLLGSGCSSLIIDKKEIGISTMKSLAKRFYDEILTVEEKIELKNRFNFDLNKEKFRRNIEYFLGSLHSIDYFYETTSQKGNEKNIISATIKKVKEFIIETVLNEKIRRNNDDDLLNQVYERFYRKLLFRNSNLPKPNIFTTNYDLYSEYALDKLGINYVNGFTGGINKYFNPTIFNYALAEKMDLTQNKWSVIDNIFYLYKLHGSINWIQSNDDMKLFNVKELQDPTASKLKKDVVMIYPSPLKHNASLGSPYSDLFREFQKKLMQNNNILVTIGYSFSDEHINNLIYQSFTIPSFRLIVIANPTPKSEIAKLRSLNDPRIWIIGGELEGSDKLHYFKGFVDHILPDLNNDEIDTKIENAIKTLLKR